MSEKLKYDIEALRIEVESRRLTDTELVYLITDANWLYEYHGYSEAELINMSDKELVETTYSAMADYANSVT